MDRESQYAELMAARYRLFQALGTEDWASQYPGNEVVYPPGVLPSSEQLPALLELEEAWIRDAPAQ